VESFGSVYGFPSMVTFALPTILLGVGAVVVLRRSV